MLLKSSSSGRRVRVLEARDTVDLWPQLLYLNSAGAVHDSFDLETGLYLRAKLPGGEHRARVAQWDAWNLFMAARLRVATAQVPGGRVLAFVGSAHKGPLEAALSALGPDLRLAQLTELEG